jgi:transcriptional regulator with XRE-family HTH domain
VSDLLEQLRQSFSDEDYRNSYSESFMNSYVAAQIKVLREEYPLTQEQLAAKSGTKQSGVARLENVNYFSWKVETLRKIARALNVRLKITFEEFGTLPDEVERFNREALLRAPFDRDPVFASVPAELGQIGDLAESDSYVGIRFRPEGSITRDDRGLGAADQAQAVA